MDTKESNMQEVSKQFRIRHKITGKYQKGGSHVLWDSKGKTWINKAGLNNHLNLVTSLRGRYSALGSPQDTENWEIITLEVIKTPISTTDLKDW